MPPSDAARGRATTPAVPRAAFIRGYGALAGTRSGFGRLVLGGVLHEDAVAREDVARAQLALEHDRDALLGTARAGSPWWCTGTVTPLKVIVKSTVVAGVAHRARHDRALQAEALVAERRLLRDRLVGVVEVQRGVAEALEQDERRSPTSSTASTTLTPILRRFDDGAVGGAAADRRRRASGSGARTSGPRLVLVGTCFGERPAARDDPAPRSSATPPSDDRRSAPRIQPASLMPAHASARRSLERERRGRARRARLPAPRCGSGAAAATRRCSVNTTIPSEQGEQHDAVDLHVEVAAQHGRVLVQRAPPLDRVVHDRHVDERDQRRDRGRASLARRGSAGMRRSAR